MRATDLSHTSLVRICISRSSLTSANACVVNIKACPLERLQILSWTWWSFWLENKETNHTYVTLWARSFHRLFRMSHISKRAAEGTKELIRCFQARPEGTPALRQLYHRPSLDDRVSHVVVSWTDKTVCWKVSMGNSRKLNLARRPNKAGHRL